MQIAVNLPPTKTPTSPWEPTPPRETIDVTKPTAETSEEVIVKTEIEGGHVLEIIRVHEGIYQHHIVYYTAPNGQKQKIFAKNDRNWRLLSDACYLLHAYLTKILKIY
ncbi:hypothetical protein CMI37_08410 [Candidatus Pacearchaeota archaeon]|nr:hypothetical protein [Candidatus Pacearchaeota archaeon]